MQREQYKPALTMLLQQQQQQGPQSPYRSKQAARGLGRQQSQAQQQQLQAKSAKGLLRSASAANMPTAQRLAPLPQRQTAGQGQGQQQGQSKLGQSAAPADLWQSDPSLPPSAQGRRPEQQQQTQQQQPATRQLRGSASSGVLVAARPGESLESQAYRSMPAHTYAGSHFYSPAPSNAQRLVHTHQYPDGSRKTLSWRTTPRRSSASTSIRRAVWPTSSRLSICPIPPTTRTLLRRARTSSAATSASERTTDRRETRATSDSTSSTRAWPRRPDCSR